MPAKASSSFDITGNLRANGDSTATTKNKMMAGMNYVLTADSSVYADGATDLTLIGQLGGGAPNFTGAAGGDQFDIVGALNDGSPVSTTFYPGAGATLDDLITEINTMFSGSSTATLENGEIILTDDATGYSQTDISISFTGSGGTPATFETPNYFQYTEAGGNDNAPIAIEIYDSMGGKHSLAGQFVKTDTANTWDLVLTSMSGDIEQIVDRRIEGIEFDTADGSYKGINGVDTSELKVKWSFDSSVTQTLDINLGTPGKLDGLTQFKLEKASLGSTVNATGDDGYKAGSLSSVSASDGKIVGMFSNGVKKDIATVALAVFKNPSGLEAMGSGYFTSSANSGQAVITESRSSGAGTVVGQQLEKSNVDVAAEFVNMIQAQNGYQANARTIRVANEVLQELTNLIR
jgi:flagellar hook protein FlgE